MFSSPSMLWAGDDKEVVEKLNPNNSIKKPSYHFSIRANPFPRVCLF
jgi:hypothetical protein